MRPQTFLPAILILVCTLSACESVYSNTIVRMESSLGDIYVELFDQDAPVTVANFLNYVRRGDYDQSFIHRSAVNGLGQPFIIQGGGYRYINNSYTNISQDPTIVNEFDPARSNLRGTIAMAKLPSGPDTASNQWFFNLNNNSANLDNQNGGFTVFGQVVGSNSDTITTNDGSSMLVVDGIAALNRYNGTSISSPYSGAWSEIPLISYVLGQNINPLENLVFINSIRETNHLLRTQDFAGNTVTLTVPSPAILTNLVASDTPNLSGMPPNVVFAEGFFSFQIIGLTPGSSTSVAIELPTDYHPNTYYMYGPTPDNASPQWYEFRYNGQTGAEFFGNNYVVLHFIDGQRGDADLLANGQITDPGAPGIAPTSASSSSGGGCSLASDIRSPSKRLDYWLILACMLAFRMLTIKPSRLSPQS